jgi:hypothetical protein
VRPVHRYGSVWTDPKDVERWRETVLERREAEPRYKSLVKRLSRRMKAAGLGKQPHEPDEYAQAKALAQLHAAGLLSRERVLSSFDLSDI